MDSAARHCDTVIIPLATRMSAVLLALHATQIIVNDCHSGNWKCVPCRDGTVDPVLVDIGAAYTLIELGALASQWAADAPSTRMIGSRVCRDLNDPGTA